MKTIKYIIGVALATMLIACSSDYEHLVLEIPEVPIIPEIVAETIPLSDVLEEMFSAFDLLPAQEGRTRSTRSAMEQQMSVATIYAHHVGASTRFATRSTSQEDEDVPLLYVVNFEEGGFSILAASTHIPATVIAISNESNFCPSHFSIYDNRFIPCEELGSDFQLFNTARNDYYVASGDEIGNFIAGMIVQFSMNGQEIYDRRPPPEFYCPGAPPPTWRVVRQVGSLMHPNITSWRQWYPFNTAAPMRGPVWNRGLAPVGCVPLALAQIITHNAHPQTTTWNGRTASWFDKQRFASWNSSTTNTGLTIAQMLRVIGSDVNALYTRNWTFALPFYAERFLNRIGYRSVNLRRYYYEDGILAMIRNNRPVFVAAVSGVVNGHAWVIDGYMIRERGLHTQQTLVHCVWGWGGRGNGWYESGIFNSMPVIHNNTHGHFLPGFANWNKNNWIFRTIMYTIP